MKRSTKQLNNLPLLNLVVPNLWSQNKTSKKLFDEIFSSEIYKFMNSKFSTVYEKSLLLPAESGSPALFCRADIVNILMIITNNKKVHNYLV